MLTEHTLHRPGCVVHFWLGGREDAPLVVLLHGATMDHHMFAPQFEALAEHYRLLVWDTRGHGLSRPMSGAFHLTDCTDDLIALLDHLKAEQAVLVGQSMGGMIVQHVYLKAPERVKAIAIIGSVNIALPFATWEVWALKASLPLFRLWPYAHLKQTIAKGTSVKPGVQQYALDTLNQLSREEFLTIWQPFTLAVDEKGIPGHHIHVPLLLTHGEFDNTGSIRKVAPTWAAYDPQVEYVVIPDAGHNANQDNPDFFNPVLVSFLRQHADK